VDKHFALHEYVLRVDTDQRFVTVNHIIVPVVVDYPLYGDNFFTSEQIKIAVHNDDNNTHYLPIRKLVPVDIEVELELVGILQYGGFFYEFDTLGGIFAHRYRYTPDLPDGFWKQRSVILIGYEVGNGYILFTWDDVIRVEGTDNATKN
jgi:hypothetical protein